MAKYIEGVNRNQLVLFPESLDDFIKQDNDVRFIDAFVDSLDLNSLGFKFASLSSSKKGAPSYDPRVILKIFLYSYPKKIRSSRKMALEVSRNIELMWLTNRLSPDFRTLSDFRKNNTSALKNVLVAFNNMCIDLKLFSNDLISIDGSKFKAVNSKDNNFTKDKLVDRIKRIECNISEYLSMIDSNDKLEQSVKNDYQAKIDLWNKKKDEYTNLLPILLDSTDAQISLTDKDARLMKCNNNMLVGYNAQFATDTKSHIITHFSISNDAFDNGKIFDTASPNLSFLNSNLVYALCDGGYVLESDIKKCFENKIVPILPDGVYSVTFDYQETDITPQIKIGDSPKDVQTCLHAGVIPDCYSDLNLNIELIDSFVSIPTDDSLSSFSDEDRLSFAKKGYFVRSSSNLSAFCPQGNSLPLKKSKTYDDIFVGGSFCLKCPNKCCKSLRKELQFSKRNIIQGTPKYKTQTPKIESNIVSMKVVKLTYIPDKQKYKLRKNTSEHPFGTIKRTHDASYFLTKGVDKVSGEMALSVLGYNLRRITSLLSIQELLKYLKNKQIYS